MDATGAALVQAVEPYGLMPLFFLGAGVAAVADAFSLGAPQVEVFGKDVLLTYDLEKER